MRSSRAELRLAVPPLHPLTQETRGPVKPAVRRQGPILMGREKESSPPRFGWKPHGPFGSARGETTTRRHQRQRADGFFPTKQTTLSLLRCAASSSAAAKALLGALLAARVQRRAKTAIPVNPFPVRRGELKRRPSLNRVSRRPLRAERCFFCVANNAGKKRPLFLGQCCGAFRAAAAWAVSSGTAFVWAAVSRS